MEQKRCNNTGKNSKDAVRTQKGNEKTRGETLKSVVKTQKTQQNEAKRQKQAMNTKELAQFAIFTQSARS